MATNGRGSADAPAFRVGLIVPSSNTTMETEIPAMLRRREAVEPETFTFHSSRMRMKRVEAAELKAMDADSDRCAVELSDARCDVLAYACLVAIMAQGAGYHEAAETRLGATAAANGGPAPVVTSAGALVDGLRTLGANRVAMIAPYVRSLTCLVEEYITGCGVEVVDSISLEVPDSLAVGRLPPAQLLDLLPRLNTREVDAVILSACVQMPSLPSIQLAEDRLGLPVLSAATATTWAILRALGLSPQVPNAGRLLSGAKLRPSANGATAAAPSRH